MLKSRVLSILLVAGFVVLVAAGIKGLGCTLVVDLPSHELATRIDAIPQPAPALPRDFLWPEGEMIDEENLPAEVDREKLKKAIEFAFVDPDPIHPIRTRAVVAVYHGRIIAEKYAIH